LSRRTILPALTIAALSALIGPAVAQADMPPFPLTCEGRLDYNGRQYFFAEGDKPLNANPDDNIICAHVTIAEKSAGTAIRQTVKETAIIRLLGSCRVGASCKVSGSVLNLSHDDFLFVRIDSISAN
jgi:hypothetical protein